MNKIMTRINDESMINIKISKEIDIINKKLIDIINNGSVKVNYDMSKIETSNISSYASNFVKYMLYSKS